MEYFAINSKDQKLIDAAIDVIRRNYSSPRHTVGSAVLCSSGKIYTGVNIECCGYGPCAEPIALGTAISNGEREIMSIVAVGIGGIHIPLCLLVVIVDRSYLIMLLIVWS